VSVAIYPGSFDPATNGHINLIRRAASVFDRVVVAVAYNIRKSCLFSPGDRVDMLREACAVFPNVEVDSFEGLLVDYMRRRKCRITLRGLRAVSDFEYEFQMAHMNQKLDADIETVFLAAGAEEFFISSGVVREVASLGGDVTQLVPPVVRERLLAKMKA
jgi:pantetheine-phosphate adenylyltransferase